MKLLARLGGPVRWECSLGRVLTTVRPYGAPHSTQLWKIEPGASTGGCSPGSSQLYRLDVWQAQKVKVSGYERPRLGWCWLSTPRQSFTKHK